MVERPGRVEPQAPRARGRTGRGRDMHSGRGRDALAQRATRRGRRAELRHGGGPGARVRVAPQRGVRALAAASPELAARRDDQVRRRVDARRRVRPGRRRREVRPQPRALRADGPYARMARERRRGWHLHNDGQRDDHLASNCRAGGRTVARPRCGVLLGEASPRGLPRVRGHPEAHSRGREAGPHRDVGVPQRHGARARVHPRRARHLALRARPARRAAQERHGHGEEHPGERDPARVAATSTTSISLAQTGSCSWSRTSAGRGFPPRST